MTFSVGFLGKINKYVTKCLCLLSVLKVWLRQSIKRSVMAEWYAFSLQDAHQRRYCGWNLLWTHQGVTVSRGCQRLVDGLRAWKIPSLGMEEGRLLRRAGVCVSVCVKALTCFSLLHQPLSILQTIGLHPHSGPFPPPGVTAALFRMTSTATGRSKSLPNWMLTV